MKKLDIVLVVSEVSMHVWSFSKTRSRLAPVAPTALAKNAPPGFQRQKSHTQHHPTLLLVIQSSDPTPWTHPITSLGGLFATRLL